jgi:hypothetical protein
VYLTELPGGGYAYGPPKVGCVSLSGSDRVAPVHCPVGHVARRPARLGRVTDAGALFGCDTLRCRLAPTREAQVT